MDWGIIAQATFFVAIAFLAIVITIFVFSTSLLGLAVEKASSERKTRQQKQEQESSQRYSNVQEKLVSAMKKENESEIRALSESLAEWGKQLKKDKKDLKNIPKKYTLPFTVRGGVIYPSLGFFLAAIFSGVAWSLAGNLTPVMHVLWGLAVVSIIYGVYRLHISLKAIEEVSVTSEEGALNRTVKALKRAQTEFEEERRPELQLTFREPTPPIQTEQGCEVLIKFDIDLTRGMMGRQARVRFLAPPNFDFVTENTMWNKDRQPEDADVYASYTRATLILEQIMPRTSYGRQLTIKTPTEPGTFNLVYRLECEQFVSRLEEFKVVVTPEDDLPFG